MRDRQPIHFIALAALAVFVFTGGIGESTSSLAAEKSAKDTDFFERKIRPLFVKHCYECHSEAAKEQQGGLLLDRRSGWLNGGDTEKAVVPGEPESSLLMAAVRYTDGDLQMPPDGKLSDSEIRLLEQWIRKGAAGPKNDPGETEFSRLGDQGYLFEKAKDHWAFQPVVKVEPKAAIDSLWDKSPIDRFVLNRMLEKQLTPSKLVATSELLFRRMKFVLNGLPPTVDERQRFEERRKSKAIPFDQRLAETVDELLDSPAFGEHFGRMWLDVARYADTDGAYRPDTKTPHYFPFAFTYRDYVIDSFNADKPFDQFVKEQLAADLMGFDKSDREIAALGFLAVGPHAKRNQTEALDDWIDVTSRGLMGMTVACARCHDHKYEPIPTADYYSMRGVFAAIDRLDPLDERRLPAIDGYQPEPADQADYKKKRAAINKKIASLKGKKAKNNNRPLDLKIRETELAELLLFHPGGPAHAMVVKDKAKPPRTNFVFLRGEATQRGEQVPKRFLKIVEPQQPTFDTKGSGRLELANRIVDPTNPLTARVIVNRVWGFTMGSYLVETPSDFGLQGSPPTHPELLDWLTADFIEHGWSIKHLVRTIVLSKTWQQSSRHREDQVALDPQNKLLWRANRRHLSIEAIRDSALAVSGNLDRSLHGRAGKLWSKKYTKRRTIYGYVNRFNLDPTLRAFDFPTPMQTQPKRGESIVPSQALFTLNSPFMADQAKAIVSSDGFQKCKTADAKITKLFETVFQRRPVKTEITRIVKTVQAINRMNAAAKKKVNLAEPWSVVAQSLLMSNEFQYVD